VVAAVPAGDVAAVLDLLLGLDLLLAPDLLLGGVLLAPDDVRSADRLGVGTGAPRPATLVAGAGATAADVITDPDVVPELAGVDATTAGDTGRPSAVLEPAREIRKIVPATATTTATTPPTATAGATPMREPVVAGRRTRCGFDLGADDG